MRRALRRAAALGIALLATGAIVALSRAPWPADGRDALLRLSWSGRPGRIERCRELSDAELAERPAHMRQRLECEGRAARYAVRVWRNGALLAADTVTGGGLRGDRAIHMLQEHRLAPGRHRIAVEIAAVDSAAAEEDPETESAGSDESELRSPVERLPPRLRLDTAVGLGPGGVLLVTYDPAGRRLLALTRPERPGE